MNNGPSEMSGQFFFIQWQHNFVAIASLRVVSIAEISRKWKKKPDSGRPDLHFPLQVK